MSRRRIAGLYVSEFYRRFSRRLVRVTMGKARAPDRLIAAPTDLHACDPFVAEEIRAGRFPLAGFVLVTDGESPFAMEAPTRGFAENLHSFSWLRHIRAEKSPDAFASARAVIGDWMTRHGGSISGVAWQTDVVARRVISWLSHSPVVLHDAEPGFYRRFMRSLARQVRYLDRVAAIAPDGEIRLRAAIALAMASISIPGRATTVLRQGRRLGRELERQILPDGGHISRNPRVMLDMLLDLLPLRQSYINLGHDIPPELVPAIDRIYPALRFFRHRDGNLALFNGATSTLANELASVLRYDETAGQPFRTLTHLDYHRLAAGETILIVDTGHPHSMELSQSAHCGCLSFEMSSGRHRFIVNSGFPRHTGRDYRLLSRSTAAHSTVTLSDTSCCHISQSQCIGPVMLSGVSQVATTRNSENADFDTLIASHDGYAAPFGLLHEREITLNGAGTKIRGRDSLVPAAGGKGRKGHDGEVDAVARFHIHPAIELLRESDESVLMRAPDGETWRFFSPATPVDVSEDIFFADASGMRHSWQIEIGFSSAGSGEIRWIIERC